MCTEPVKWTVTAVFPSWWAPFYQASASHSRDSAHSGMLSLVSCAALVAVRKMGCRRCISSVKAWSRCHVHPHVRVVGACALVAGLFFLWADNILTLNRFLADFRGPWSPSTTSLKGLSDSSIPSGGITETAIQNARGFVDERLLPPPWREQTPTPRRAFLLGLRSFFSSKHSPSGRGVTLTPGALFAHSPLNFAADLAALHQILRTDAASQARSDGRQTSSRFPGDVTTALPPVSLTAAVSPSEPLPGVDYPATRVFMLYVPRAVETGSGPLVLVDQAFGFIESWRYTFTVRQDGSREPLLPEERLPPDFETDPEDPFHHGPKRKGMLSWNPKSPSAAKVSREQAGSSQRELHRLGDKGQEGTQEASRKTEFAAKDARTSSEADGSKIEKDVGDSRNEENRTSNAGETVKQPPRAGASSAVGSGRVLHEGSDAENLWGALKPWWSGREVGDSVAVDTPVVNDVLVVVDPGMDRRHVPWICDELADLGGLSGYRADLQQRLTLALEERRRRRLFSLSQGANSTMGTAAAREDEEKKASNPDDRRKTSPSKTREKEQDLRRHRCIVVRVMLDETQLSPVWNKHPAMHSVSALTHPVVEWMMMQYDLGMRSDNDAFVSPALLERRNTPWIVGLDEHTGEAQFAFYVGHGAYNSDKNRLVLAEYSRVLKLRHQHVFGIGSTWYGRPADIVRAARLTVKVSQDPERPAFSLTSLEPVRAGSASTCESVRRCTLRRLRISVHVCEQAKSSRPVCLPTGAQHTVLTICEEVRSFPLFAGLCQNYILDHGFLSLERGTQQ
ncbi:transmembrane protein [Cystoisospora suis]|uniref:Transmembrane protein n=1 Tax=Cystoisospora suis TaxID=483139 RepID=A0A2C6KUR1_9APIC|nr:transmembrane protein [Cystoisospora suis]